MPLEYQCLRCCQCQAFQAKQVTKNNKFSCSMCGAKQTVQHVFAISGNAKDIRLHVQKLNTARGAAELQKLDQQAQLAAALQQQSPRAQATTQQVPSVDWSAYADEAADSEQDEFDDGGQDDARFVTCVPEKRRGKAARGTEGVKRSRVQTSNREGDVHCGDPRQTQSQHTQRPPQYLQPPQLTQHLRPTQPLQHQQATRVAQHQKAQGGEQARSWQPSAQGQIHTGPNQQRQSGAGTSWQHAGSRPHSHQQPQPHGPGAAMAAAQAAGKENWAGHAQQGSAAWVEQVPADSMCGGCALTQHETLQRVGTAQSTSCPAPQSHMRNAVQPQWAAGHQHSHHSEPSHHPQQHPQPWPGPAATPGQQTRPATVGRGTAMAPPVAQPGPWHGPGVGQPHTQSTTGGSKHSVGRGIGIWGAYAGDSDDEHGGWEELPEEAGFVTAL